MTEDERIGNGAALVYREYNELLASQGAIDFDDILLLAHRTLTERPQVARLYNRTYRYICVDEAQDLNEAQYVLIRILAADNGNVLMVGDPNQAIYGFNGSDSRFMLEHFPSDFRVQKYEMRENYRSTKAVIRGANTLFPESMDELRAPLAGLCEVWGLETEEDEAIWIVDKIEELLAMRRHPEIEGDISLNRMAILARNRYVFIPLEEELGERQIAHYLRRTGSVWEMESDIGRVFDLGLRILVNPMDRLHKGRLCEILGIPYPHGGDGADGLDQLRRTGERITDRGRSDFGVLLKAWSMLDEDINRFPQAVASLKDYASEAAAKASDGGAAEYALVM